MNIVPAILENSTVSLHEGDNDVIDMKQKKSLNVSSLLEICRPGK
jgi:hypothetical protein